MAKKQVLPTITRVRYPKGDEFIGVVEKRLGGSRMRIRKMDGSEIMAIIPGRMKRYLWIKEDNIVLLKPWAIEKEKADLIHKFKPNEIRKLEKQGYLKNLEVVEEF
jgi:translation initiation factor 1A